jgi:pimeloyl-ACP methyl ester carboxylesterase/DNA-binding winged helix-turn-helix (wHTH) protein
VTFDRFELDDVSGHLYRDSVPVPLTPKAIQLLAYLAASPGRLVPKRELLEAIWPDVFVGDGALKVCVREIRRALGDDARAPKFIETAHRRGYRFVAPVSEPPVVTVSPVETASRGPSASSIHYARSGDVNIAYQVLGSGPIDLVFVMGWVSHLEYYWKEPSFARFLERLATYSRLILFDKRGTGLSDRVTHLPTLEERMDDVRAVLDAVGSRRTALLGVSEGGPMCSLFAATYPDMTEALVMIGTYARRLRAPDYPWAPTVEQREAFCDEILERWGGPVGIKDRAPSRSDDPAFREWWAAYLRMGASPAAAVALTRMNADIDVRHILPTIRVPTLVLHRSGDRCLRVQEGKYVAGLIPGARFVELPGDDHLPFVGEQDQLLDEIERFLGEARTQSVSDRVLATILCAELSDAQAAVRSHELQSLVSAEASHFGGAGVRSVERRVFAMFDGPARAIRCGCAIASHAVQTGLQVRVGLHTGECDMLAGAPHGVVVDIAARVADLAKPAEVLVSRTVVDLVAGSRLRFADRGTHRLTGAATGWRVLAVEQAADASLFAKS